MNRKIDKKELCLAFNQLRTNNLNKKFNSTEFHEALRKLGISNKYAQEIAKTGSVRFRKMGNKTEYAFTENPLHYQQIEKIYADRGKHHKQASTPIDEAIKLLKECGYRIQKPVGLDLKTLEKENPDILEKYRIFEVI